MRGLLMRPTFGIGRVEGLLAEHNALVQGAAGTRLLPFALMSERFGAAICRWYYDEVRGTGEGFEEWTCGKNDLKAKKRRATM